jgi:hypothetical protein
MEWRVLNLIVNHICSKPVAPINYTQQFDLISATLRQILIEAQNHNQSATIDWQPILAAMQIQVAALDNIRSSADLIGAAQLAAAERINNNFLNLSRQITDFQSATMEASAALLKIEGTQAEILQQISAKLDAPIAIMQTFKGYWRAGVAGGSLLIPAGAYGLQIIPMGCFVYRATAGDREHIVAKGEGIVRANAKGQMEPSWLLKFPELAEVSIEYTATSNIGYPELENMVRITESELVGNDQTDGDAILSAAIAIAQGAINNDI